MPPLSSALLAALTFLSWPSGPHPWLRLLTTSPTELQIGQHTMPQILIHQHNALTSHTPSLLFNTLTTSLLSIPSFSFPLIHSLPSFNFLMLSPSLSLASLTWSFWQLVVVTGGPTTETISRLFPSQGSMSGQSQSSQSHCRAKQRLCAPSFKPGPLRQLPPPRSH